MTQNTDSGMLKVTQVRSGIGGTVSQRATLQTLGLRRIGATSIRKDVPETRGMLRTVAHLVTVESVSAEEVEK